MANKTNTTSSKVKTTTVNNKKRGKVTAEDLTSVNAGSRIANDYNVNSRSNVSDEKYNNAKSYSEDLVRNNRVDSYLKTDRKLTKSEQKRAKAEAEEYLSKHSIEPSDTEYFESPELAQKKRDENFASMSKEERDNYLKMNALNNKVDNKYSFARGMATAIPFLEPMISKQERETGTTMPKGTSNEEQKKSATTQSPIANALGAITGQAAMYGLANTALEGVQGFDKAGNAIAKATPFLGDAKGQTIANILRGQTADTVLDTLPRIAEDISSGKSGGEVTGNALKNQATNLLFNAAFEAIPDMLDAYKTLKNEDNTAKKVVEDLKIKDISDDASLDIKPKEEIPSNVIQFPGNAKSTDIPTIKPNLESPNSQTVENVVEDTKNVVNSVDDATKNVVENEIPKLETEDLGNGKTKQRGYAKSIQDKTDLPEEIKAEFDDDMYKVLSNKETSAKADANYVEGDITQSVNNFNTLISAKDPSAIPLGYRIASDLIDTGDDVNKAQAVDILRQMSKELTRSGQFSQSAAITLMKNDPMAAMRYMQKEIDSLNTFGAKKYRKKWSEVSLTPDEISAFNSINPGDKEAISNLYDQIKARVGKEIPSSVWEKIVSVEKTAMLLNPLTHVRNVGANVALMPIRSLTDRVSALGQNAVHIINPDFKVTQSLTGGTKEQKAIASDFFESIKDTVLGENKMRDNISGDILAEKQIFKDSLLGKWVNEQTNGGIEKLNKKFGRNVEGNIYETIANFNTWMMGEVEDNPFVKKNFVNRLASYMNAQGIKSANEIPQEAVSLAIEEAMKATFKDNNALTKLMSGFKRHTGAFGEMVLPFTKTPANLAMRALDYSPVGIVNSVRKLNETKDVAKFIDDLSKNATGTAGIFLGYELAKNGVISGAYSDDVREKNYQKANGEQEYAINIGKIAELFGIEGLKGKSYTYDWAQPASIPLIIGTTIYDAVQKSDKEDADVLDYLNMAKDASVASIDQWLSLSPVQSLKELFSGDGYGDDSFGENLLSTLSDFPGRFIPSAVGAAARTKDDVIRDIYDKTSSANSWLNSLQSKVPGKTEELPASYDIWGRERTRSNSLKERVAEQWFSPGKIGNDTSVGFDDELNRLAEATGNKASDLAPESAARYFTLNGKQKNLTNEEHSKYQKEKGTLASQFTQAILNSDMSDEGKADAIKKSNSFVDRLAKEKLFNYTTNDDKKLKAAYDANGIEGAIEYWKGTQEDSDTSQANATIENMGVKTNKTTQKIYDSYGKQGLDEYKAALNIANSLGKDSISESDFKTYQKYGVDSFKQKIQSSVFADEYDVGNNGALREALATGTEQQYVDAYNAITSIPCGKDDWGDDKYLTYTDKTASIYNEKSTAGLQQYASIKSALPSDYSDTELMNQINKSNMSDADKAYFYVKMKSNKLAKVPSLMDNVEDQYNWYYFKSMLDTDKSGGLNKKEKANLVPMLQNMNYSPEYISKAQTWY